MYLLHLITCGKVCSLQKDEKPQITKFSFRCRNAGMVKFVYCQGRRQRGGQWCPAPSFEIGAPHFTFDPPAAAYIQYCILKMCPPSGLWPHHNFCGNIAKLQNDEIYHILRTSQLTYRKECWFGEIYILWQLQCSPRYLK